MKVNRNKDVIENYFGSRPAAQINAVFKNGKFIDVNSHKEIVLAENAQAKIITLLENISDEDYMPHSTTEIRQVLPPNSELYVKLPMGGSELLIFNVRIDTPLTMKKIGNKLSVVEPCKCIVTSVYDPSRKIDITKFSPFEAPTLNQVFFQASMKYRPANKSHTTNIYQSCFITNTKKLSDLRF